jgi:outer membrane protein assembly factor BamB
MMTFPASVRVCAVASLLPLAASTAFAQWPQFRGPNGSGVDTGSGYPVKFSATENVLWKVPVPSAQSSPVVVGERVYLTTSDAERLITICLDAASGRELWRREIPRTRKAEVYPANDPASPTPAADEKGVVVFFEDFGLAAYTPGGKDRWTLPLGPFKNFYGMASSPILVDDMVVMLCDQQKGAFLLALDAKTGAKKWRTERAEGVMGWATPMVFRPSAAGLAQLVVLGSLRLDSYSLTTGESIWWTPLASDGAIGTAVAQGDTVFVSTQGSAEPWMPTFESVLEKHDANKDQMLSRPEFAADQGIGQHFGWIDADGDGLLSAKEWAFSRSLGLGDFGAIAVRPGDARGQLPASAVLWRVKRNVPYIPAPILYEGVLYLVKDGGIITTLDLKTGAILKQGRTEGAIGQYYASPVAAEGRLFLANVAGKVSVVQAGASSWEVLAVNDLGENIRATPALSGGRIFIRTEKSLFCFGVKGERKDAN